MIYTSYFAKFKGKPYEAVSIATRAPKGFTGHECLELAPDWELVMGLKTGKITEKEYRRKYKNQLQQLDVHKFASMLEGKTLLCYETPEKFCHRRIIRAWFRHFGYECEERDN